MMIQIRAYKSEMGTHIVSIESDGWTVFFDVASMSDAKSMAAEMDSTLTMYAMDRCEIVEDAQAEYDQRVKDQHIKNAAKNLPAMPTAQDFQDIVKQVAGRTTADGIPHDALFKLHKVEPPEPEQEQNDE